MRSSRSVSPTIIAAALLLAGCSGDPLSGARTSLNDAKSRWEQQALDDYSFHYRRLCFCPTDVVAPVIVTVRKDTVAEVIYADTRQPVPARNLPDYDTIDELFETIQDVINRKLYTITVTYDATQGFPRSASFDYAKDAVDDELSFTVDSVRALP